MSYTANNAFYLDTRRDEAAAIANKKGPRDTGGPN
jgi:hypothetical protein